MRVSATTLDEIAKRYHIGQSEPDMFIEKEVQLGICRWIATVIRPNDCVIELGFGDGVTAERLHTLSRRYVVVEGASSLVQIATLRHPGMEVAHAMFESYVPPESANRLLALHVLEHVDDPVAILRKLSSWLVEDGELIVVVPNAESIHRRLAVAMGLQEALDTLSARDRLVGHLRVYSRALLEEHLRAGGFEVIETRGFFLKTLPNSMMLGYQPSLIRALVEVSDQLPTESLANLALRCRRVTR